MCCHKADRHAETAETCSKLLAMQPANYHVLYTRARALGRGRVAAKEAATTRMQVRNEH